MPDQRAAGILLHPTSLPGPGGIGTIGPAAYGFVDTLVSAGMGLWQVLPLGPTGYGDSPYAGLSAFAGNPMLVALEPLIRDGFLSDEDVHGSPCFSESHVDFGAVIPWKTAVLEKAYRRFTEVDRDREALQDFCAQYAFWLDDFALFAALKAEHGGAPWNEWNTGLRERHPAALQAAVERLSSELGFHRWIQFTFYRQWTALKQYANARGIRLIGDIPIFVAYDSADVWAHQHLFKLARDGSPEVVAGVPPDYFSRTGQLWGNPHYRWDVMAQSGYEWWIARFRTLQRLVDIVRLDHFRGFAASWEVPYGHDTAENGRWVDGPGEAFFDAVRASIHDLFIIAEDLGIITPDVNALRERYGFPGMKVFQFAFGSDARNDSLPHEFERNVVVYTGTHDNDTTLGWWSSIAEEERSTVRRYLGTSGIDVVWDLIRLAFASVSRYVVVPLQDVLRLGTAARMNLPGRPDGNWGWRFRRGDVAEALVADLRSLAETYGRLPAESRPEDRET